MAMEDFKLRGKVVLDGKEFELNLQKMDQLAQRGSDNIARNMLGAVTAANLAAKAIGLLAAKMKSAVGEYMSLDESMAKVNTLLDKQKVSSAMLRNELMRVSSATGIYSSELAEASYQALSAGIQTDKLSGFIQDMAILSQAGFTSVSSAVEVTAQIMNAYGQEVYSSAEISDKLVRAQERGVLTVDQLSKSLYNVVPAAASLGVSLDEVLGGIALLTKNGVPTAQATTQMRQAILDLADETSGAGEAFKNLTGEAFLDFIKRGGTLTQAIKALEIGAQKAGVPILQLFSRIEGGQAALILAKDGAEGFRREVEELGNSAGSTERAHKTATDNIKLQWQKMGMELGNSLSGFLIDNERLITGIVRSLTTFTKNSLYELSYGITLIGGTLQGLYHLANFEGKEAQKVLVETYNKLRELEREHENSGAISKQSAYYDAYGAAVKKRFGEDGGTEKPETVSDPDTSGSVGTGKKGDPEAEKRKAERAARDAFLQEQREYYKNRSIVETEFNATQLQNDIEFFNQMSALRENHWYDDNDFAQMQQDYEYNQFLEEQQFRLEQLEADKAFYEGKEEYAVQYAETLAKIKELELDTIKYSVERKEELEERELSFTDRINKSKEQLIKGAYSSMVSNNKNILKSLGEFLTQSIATISQQHGAELLYRGIKDIGIGKADVAIGAAMNAKAPGSGVALMAAGANTIKEGTGNIALSAMFGAASFALGSVGGGSSSGGSSGGSAAPYYTETTAEAENTIGNLENDKTLKIYTDGDISDVFLSLLDSLNTAAKDGFNVEIINK